MIDRTLWEAARELQRFLESGDYRFCFIGGIAFQRWGEPRVTEDLDVTFRYGATKERVDYIALEGLVELKLASRRLKDQADVVELIRFNRDRMPDLERYLDGIHPDYATMLKALEAEATD